MTMFAGYINVETLILPIMDNFILEERAIRSWRRLYCLILAFLSHHSKIIMTMKDVSDVAVYF